MTNRARFRTVPFVLAGAVSAALVLGAPFIGEIRRALLLRFPGQFVRIVGGVVAFAIMAAVFAALARIRERRTARYAGVGIALAVAAGYAWFSRTGNPQVDAVERFHFVEYGLVTLLFYRAWRPAADASALVLPILAGVLVGTVEEWFQWFIPVRVGEVRDVFLNGVAIGCGLIFSVALEPPIGSRLSMSPASLRRTGAFGAVVLVVFGAFFQSVHLGHEIEGPGWRFRSAYTGPQLETLASDRASRWRGAYVDVPRRLSAEDQYMTEGHWHVARRNEAWSAGEVAAAWHENQILERYFAPVIDTPSYLSRTGHRWTPEHKADAERRLQQTAAAGVYESAAQPSEIFVWSRSVYWTIVILASVALAAPWLRVRVRGEPTPPRPTASAGR